MSVFPEVKVAVPGLHFRSAVEGRRQGKDLASTGETILEKQSTSSSPTEQGPARGCCLRDFVAPDQA